MTYAIFQNKVNALVSRAEGVKAKFKNDTETGRFFANCSNGVTIIGNATCSKVSVKWGSGHRAEALI